MLLSSAYSKHKEFPASHALLGGDSQESVREHSQGGWAGVAKGNHRTSGSALNPGRAGQGGPHCSGLVGHFLWYFHVLNCNSVQQHTAMHKQVILIEMYEPLYYS